MLPFVAVVVRRGECFCLFVCFVLFVFRFPSSTLFCYSLFLFVIRTQERLKKIYIYLKKCLFKTKQKNNNNFSMKTRFQKPRFCQCTKPGPQRSKLYTYASVVIVT